MTKTNMVGEVWEILYQDINTFYLVIGSEPTEDDVFPGRLIIVNLFTGDINSVYDGALFSGSTIWSRVL